MLTTRTSGEPSTRRSTGLPSTRTRIAGVELKKILGGSFFNGGALALRLRLEERERRLEPVEVDRLHVLGERLLEAREPGRRPSREPWESSSRSVTFSSVTRRSSLSISVRASNQTTPKVGLRRGGRLDRDGGPRRESHVVPLLELGLIDDELDAVFLERARPAVRILLGRRFILVVRGRRDAGDGQAQDGRRQAAHEESFRLHGLSPDPVTSRPASRGPACRLRRCRRSRRAACARSPCRPCRARHFFTIPKKRNVEQRPHDRRLLPARRVDPHGLEPLAGELPALPGYVLVGEQGRLHLSRVSGGLLVEVDDRRDRRVDARLAVRAHGLRPQVHLASVDPLDPLVAVGRGALTGERRRLLLGHPLARTRPLDRARIRATEGETDGRENGSERNHGRFLHGTLSSPGQPPGACWSAILLSGTATSMRWSAAAQDFSNFS